MLPLIATSITFVLWALFIITTYYSTFYSSVDHISVDYISDLIGTEWFVHSPFGKYIMSIWLVYCIYKIFTIFFLEKKEIRFWLLGIIWWFLMHLFIVCVAYAWMREWQQMLIPVWAPWAMKLFIHILSLLIYPIILTLIMRVSWQRVIEFFIPTWTEKDKRITVLADIVIGFFILSTLLLFVSSIGAFSMTSLIFILISMSMLGWKNWTKTYHDIRNSYVVFDNHHTSGWFIGQINPRLLSAEFAFFILTLMMSVAMISIVRPMPIGWDDLGVYMNFPKIMALSGNDLPGTGMYVWQQITATGFLFSYNAAQAFFINQLWSMLAVFAISLSLSVILEKKEQKAIISLPIILAALYYVMPMTIFHHTKDMKLDPGLLFVSISAFMVFYGFIRTKEFGNKKELYSILWLLGIMLGFAFSIKVTTLMLVLGILWLWSYRMLSFWGYMWFFFSFLSIFTGANLWSIMNVWMPHDTQLLLTISGILLLLWVASYSIALVQNTSKKLSTYIIGVCIILWGFIAGISPWIIKNTSEVKPWNTHTASSKDLLMSSVLGGSGAGFQPDFNKIMTPAEYTEKTKAITSNSIDNDGQSRNEDFGRYFGYEEGINNYLKLPINLTFQKNQSGEFTSITYIFLALIPVLFLFARGKYRYTYTWIVSLMLLLTFAYAFMGKSSGSDGATRRPVKLMLESVNNTIIENEDFRAKANITQGSTAQEFWEKIEITKTYLSDIWNLIILRPVLLILNSIEPGTQMSEFFSLKDIQQYSLLYGYAILLVINIAFISVIHFLTKNEDEDNVFREACFILNTYGFLFLISAFGIVWYGIFVYFIFFILIWSLASRFIYLDSRDAQNSSIREWKLTMTAFLFVFISIYFIKTATPHAWTNLKNAGFNEYKYNILNQEESIFAYRSDYLVPIASMNLKDLGILTQVIDKIQSPKLKSMLIDLSTDKIGFLEGISQIIPQAQKSRDSTLRNDGKVLAKFIYNKVLYPTKEEENTGWIYRIGTFMTYLINKNNTRYYDDSLIFGFNGYFYENNPEKTIEKMKTLWFKYLLIDLNAATIDRDPRRALTKRYENLLLTMRAKNLKLISTDNTCLQFALDEYKYGKYKTDQDFIDIAGTNYESYRENGSGNLIPIGRQQKMRQCYNVMLKTISEPNWVEKHPYLAPLQQAITQNNAGSSPEMLSRIMSSFAGQSFFALYEITDIPTEWTSQVNVTGSGTIQ